MKYLGTCRIDERARLTNARAETIFTLMARSAMREATRIPRRVAARR